MSAHEDLTRILDVVAEEYAEVDSVVWQVLNGNGTTSVRTVDCASFTALCDRFGAKRDDGRWLGANQYGNTRRHFDALTKDNRVLVEHVCWPHLDCWRSA